MEIGFSEVEFDICMKMLDDLPKANSDSAISDSAVAALRPARNWAAQKVRNYGKGTDSGFSKAKFISRNIKVKKSRKGYPPGAQIKVLGPDVPVGDRNWKSAGYAKLIAYGSYKKGKRNWRRKPNKNTGSVDGIGNFILEGVQKNIVAMRSKYEEAVIKEMDKAAKKVGFNGSK